MFGGFRFFLALLVIIEHIGFIRDFHPGAMAVVAFYVLAGYVMTHSFEVNFGGERSRVRAFYADRALRIFPAYWGVCAVSLVLFSLTASIRVRLDLVNVLSMVTLVPLNYWMFTSRVFSVNESSFPIPPAPSLALEAQFYLLFPLFFWSKGLRDAGLAGSLAVYLLAGLTLIPTYLWGYALLPGTLHLFIVGMHIYRMHHGPDVEGARARVLLTSAVMLAFLLYFTWRGLLLYPHTLEVLAGYFFAVTGVAILGPVKERSRFDDYLGKLSYPMFLGHHMVILPMQSWLSGHRTGWDRATNATVQTLLALIVAALVYHLLDAPWQRVRKRVQLALVDRSAKPAVAEPTPGRRRRARRG